MSFFDELWDAGAFRRRSIPLTGGAISFVLATLLLMELLKTDETLEMVIVSGIWVAVLAAFFTGVGRTYAVGFVAAIIAGSTMTMGFLLIVWASPLIAAYVAIDQASAQHAKSAKFAEVTHTRAISRRSWINSRRAEPPILAHGQILANAVNECAAAYREIDSVGSYPRNIDELETVSCNGLAVTSSDTSFFRYIENDRGWRWTYTPGAADSVGRISDYRVRVFEDPVIDRPSPQYVTDATGAVREFDIGRPPTIVATPIESLERLRGCIAQVPEQRANDTYVQRTYSQYRNPINEVLFRCKTLGGAVTAQSPEQKYGEINLLAGRSNGVVDTVGTYHVYLVPVDERQFIFELSATPTAANGFHAGSRRYFVSRDGAIHARNGDAASGADPLAEPTTTTVPHPWERAVVCREVRKPNSELPVAGCSSR